MWRLGGLLSAVCLVLQTCSGSIYDQVRHFETVREDDVITSPVARFRRDASGVPEHVVDVSFRAFGRHFHTRLKPDSSVLAQGFQVKVVKRDGEFSPLNLDGNDFFSGYVKGRPGSRVEGHREDDLWLLHVFDDDVYTLEPSWRYLGPGNDSLLVYRHSDLRLPQTRGHKLCGGPARPDNWDGQLSDDATTSNDTGRRHKRQSYTLDYNTCQLLLVADYRFHRAVGKSLPHRTANYLVSVLRSVDNIYRATTFGDMHGYGVQIKQMWIQESPTEVSPGQEHYNMERDSWEHEKLLRAFGDDPRYHAYCLAHLFTATSFPSGVVGLAYISSDRAVADSGMCARPFKTSGKYLSWNTGFTTALYAGGDLILSQAAMLVTAHEIGHNWGSEHDTDADGCSPSSYDGGKFLMYPYTNTGYEPNNFKFSECSKRYLTRVLKARAHKCFTQLATAVAICGNAVVDQGEECDAGATGDNCCSPDCRFRPGATCSPYNKDCCLGCRMAPRGTLCRVATSSQCLQDSRCTGDSYDCPGQTAANDGQPCADGGKCRRGLCLTYCESLVPAQTPCQCDNNVTDACLRCCREGHGPCRPHGNQRLPEGRPCYLGFCQGGQCQRVKDSIVQRVHSFLEYIATSGFARLMRDNLVGVIIVLSLIVWIPSSWAITCLVDRRQQRKAGQAEDERVEAPRRGLTAKLPSRDTSGTVISRAKQRHLPARRTRGDYPDGEETKPMLHDVHFSDIPEEAETEMI